MDVVKVRLHFSKSRKDDIYKNKYLIINFKRHDSLQSHRSTSSALTDADKDKIP